LPRVFDSSAGSGVLSADAAVRIGRVLRLSVSGRFIAFNGAGREYICEVSGVIKRRDGISVTYNVIDVTGGGNEPKVEITLAQAAAKGGKMDYITQKAVELGVGRIVPVITERCAAGGVRVERLRKIAAGAAEQCGRAVVPDVTDVQPLSGAVSLTSGCAGKIVPWEEEGERSVKSCLRGFSGDSLAVFIGPEGGIAPGEAETLKAAGFSAVTLGKRILRTETAGAAVLAMALYELEL
jgi:16S rRNA (uracil1498-N3)-methyltransferase